MSKKIPLLFRQFLVLGVIGVVFSTVIPDNTPTETIQNVMPPAPQEQVRAELPVRLKIPKINLDASIEYVGLTSDGAMDVPKSPVNVAWYELGPRPGDIGSAVIAGHVGWKDGLQATFDTVATLRKGDKIYVEDADGATITFVVREQRMFDLGQDATSIFDARDGKAHLNLIACVGVWDEATKTYSKRLVVFADKE